MEQQIDRPSNADGADQLISGGYVTQNRDADRRADRRKVGIAEYAVANGGTTLITSGVGSCLGIVLHDSFNDISGLVHVMLPTADESRDSNRAKFVDSGVPLLIEAMEDAGASPQRLKGWVVGGSEMLSFSSDGDSIGSRNIAAAKHVLSEHGISVAGTDVGGSHGRSMSFDPKTETVTIRTADDTTQTI